MPFLSSELKESKSFRFILGNAMSSQQRRGLGKINEKLKNQTEGEIRVPRLKMARG